MQKEGLGLAHSLMATLPQVTDDTQDPNLQVAPEVSDEGMQEEQVPLEWNEDLDEDLQAALKDLVGRFSDEFLYPRRIEVMRCWKARSFWNELQHLAWNWDNNCWDIIGPAGVMANGSNSNSQDSAVYYATNIFQGFGESYIAIMTQSVPGVRFDPVDPDEAADVETARIADSFRRYIQRENDPIALLTKATFLSWTDGRIHGWTRWEMDKRTGKPREMQSVFGSMEVKIPLIYDDQCNYPYLQFAMEYHVSTVRAIVKARAFPDVDYWKKIKGGSSGKGEDTFERTARISVKQGISMQTAGGNDYASLCTVQRTWIRPEAFYDEQVPDDKRDLLIDKFPTGCWVEFANGVYMGSKECKLDDCWVVENIMEGDGANRNAKGTCIVSIQERFNDLINTTQDTFEKMQPASWWDEKLFDVPGMMEQSSEPGMRYGYNHESLQPGDSVSNHFGFEQPAAVDPSQLSYLKELGTEVPEFLTGVSPILFGGGGDGDKSGKALSIQQAAAMGRIGLPFRVLKRFYARMMEQAVRCAAENRNEDISIGIPDEFGQTQKISVRVGDLNGLIRCFPDSDENYPETYTARRAIMMQLFQLAENDPVWHAILTNPKNQSMIKRLIGLQDLEIPDADSWSKQMAEINDLLLTGPQMVTPPPQTVPNPMVPNVMEQVQPPPHPASTVEIDIDYDNHTAELMTVTIFLNSAKGLQLKQTNAEGIANVRQHGLEHKQAIAAMMPPPMPAPAPTSKPGAGPKGEVPPAKAASPQNTENSTAQTHVGVHGAV